MPLQQELDLERLRRVLVVDEIPLLTRELGSHRGIPPPRLNPREQERRLAGRSRSRPSRGKTPPPPSAIAARVWSGAGASNSPRSARAGGVEADERAAHRPPHHECGTSPRRSNVRRGGGGRGGTLCVHPEPIQTSRACRSQADEHHVEEARSLHRRQTISHRARSRGAHSSSIRMSDSFGKASKYD